MSSPYDPQQPGDQPYQPGYPPQGYPPQEYPPQGYPAQGYPAQGYPAQEYPSQGYPQQGYPQQGYPQQGYPPEGYPPQGYPPAGYQQWSPPPPAGPPHRPGVLIAAGVLWLLNGAFLLGVGVLTALADRLPGFEEAMRDSGAAVSSDQLLAIGITAAVLGAMIIALAVVVFNGATWARVLIMVVAVVPSAFLLVLVVFPLFTIVASVLQFLPPASRYGQAKRHRPAVP